MFGFIRGLWAHREGAAAVEFALVCVPLLVITIGIMEFAFALYQWNAAEKATQFGVRMAVVSTPVASGLNTFDGKTNSNDYGDEPMANFASSGAVVCDGATSTCNNGYTFLSTPHDRLVAKMQQVSPGITAANVVVEYLHQSLGFVGRPCGPVPSVTVRLQNMAFDFIVIDAILSLVQGGTGLPSSVTMPGFTATMVGEDLNTVGAGCQ